jgi:hypothetical protein
MQLLRGGRAAAAQSQIITSPVLPPLPRFFRKGSSDFIGCFRSASRHKQPGRKKLLHGAVRPGSIFRFSAAAIAKTVQILGFFLVAHPVLGNSA